MIIDNQSVAIWHFFPFMDWHVRNLKPNKNKKVTIQIPARNNILKTE